MFSRSITALAITLPILLVLYFENFWIFSLLIFLVCTMAFYEWIANNFKKNVFGFLLILNFGFWSIFFIYSSQTAYLFYGIIIINTAIFDSFAYIIGSRLGKTYISKKISPNKFLKVMREMIPHVSKRLFAAGKPKENNPTANMQFRLPEAVELCAFNLFSIKEQNTIKHQSLIPSGLKSFEQLITRQKPTLSSRLCAVKRRGDQPK